MNLFRKEILPVVPSAGVDDRNSCGMATTRKVSIFSCSVGIIPKKACFRRQLLKGLKATLSNPLPWALCNPILSEVSKINGFAVHPYAVHNWAQRALFISCRRISKNTPNVYRSLVNEQYLTEVIDES